MQNNDDPRCEKCGRTRLDCECLRPIIDQRDAYDRAMERADRAYEEWAGG